MLAKALAHPAHTLPIPTPCPHLPTPCPHQPEDMYWSSPAVCMLPDSLSAVGIQPCGPIVQRTLLPANTTAQPPGQLIMFQSGSRLYLTFQMSCPFVLRSSVGPSASAPYSVGVYVWSSLDFVVRWGRAEDGSVRRVARWGRRADSSVQRGRWGSPNLVLETGKGEGSVGVYV